MKYNLKSLTIHFTIVQPTIKIKLTFLTTSKEVAVAHYSSISFSQTSNENLVLVWIS